MTLKALAHAWNEFFFAPQSPVPIALFRILYGAVLIANLLLLWPEWPAWYGAVRFHALASMSHGSTGLLLSGPATGQRFHGITFRVRTIMEE